MDIFGPVLNWMLGRDTAEYNNTLAAEREATARQENYQYNEQAAQNAYGRTRQLFNNFYSMPAQMMQLREAGLSPSIYSGGISGMTGTQGSQGEGANGVSPNGFGAPNPTFNLDAISAEEALSRARLNNAQADELEGINPMGKAKADNLAADTALKLEEKGFKAASKNLIEAETKMQNIKNEIADLTFDEAIKKVIAETKEATAKANTAWTIAEQEDINLDIQKKTKEETIKQAGLRTSEILADIALKKKNKELSQEQINNLKEQTAKVIEERLKVISDKEQRIDEVQAQKAYREKQIEYLAHRVAIDWAEYGIEVGKELADAILQYYTRGLAGAGKNAQGGKKIKTTDKRGNGGKWEYTHEETFYE